MRYDEDFFTWTQEQAQALRERRFERLDPDLLADEVTDMGKSEIRAFASRLAVLIGHLLKLTVQKDRTPSNERGWRRSVVTQRAALNRLLTKNPGIMNPEILRDVLEDAWADGLELAFRETALDPDLFPAACPWSMTDLLEPGAGEPLG